MQEMRTIACLRMITLAGLGGAVRTVVYTQHTRRMERHRSLPTKSSLLLLPYSGFQRFLLPHYYPPSLYPDTDRGSLTSPASNAKRNPDATPLHPLDESVVHFSIGSVVPTPVLPSTLL